MSFGSYNVITVRKWGDPMRETRPKTVGNMDIEELKRQLESEYYTYDYIGDAKAAARQFWLKIKFQSF